MILPGIDSTLGETMVFVQRTLSGMLVLGLLNLALPMPVLAVGLPYAPEASPTTGTLLSRSNEDADWKVTLPGGRAQSNWFKTGPDSHAVVDFAGGVHMRMSPNTMVHVESSSASGLRVNLPLGDVLTTVPDSGQTPVVLTTPSGTVDSSAGCFVLKVDRQRVVLEVLEGDARLSGSHVTCPQLPGVDQESMDAVPGLVAQTGFHSYILRYSSVRKAYDQLLDNYEADNSKANFDLLKAKYVQLKAVYDEMGTLLPHEQDILSDLCRAMGIEIDLPDLPGASAAPPLAPAAPAAASSENWQATAVFATLVLAFTGGSFFNRSTNQPVQITGRGLASSARGYFVDYFSGARLGPGSSPGHPFQDGSTQPLGGAYDFLPFRPRNLPPLLPGELEDTTPLPVAPAGVAGVNSTLFITGDSGSDTLQISGPSGGLTPFVNPTPGGDTLTKSPDGQLVVNPTSASGINFTGLE
ncbi:FecR domain-containing protein [bacterium]|nr:FecR domain-containing protein [bacterium]